MDYTYTHNTHIDRCTRKGWFERDKGEWLPFLSQMSWHMFLDQPQTFPDTQAQKLLILSTGWSKNISAFNKKNKNGLSIFMHPLETDFGYNITKCTLPLYFLLFSWTNHPQTHIQWHPVKRKQIASLNFLQSILVWKRNVIYYCNKMSVDCSPL